MTTASHTTALADRRNRNLFIRRALPEILHLSSREKCVKSRCNRLSPQLRPPAGFGQRDMLSPMKLTIRLFTFAGFAAILSAAALAQAPHPATGVKYAQVSPADLKEWLSYLASDALQGRQIYTEGYGLAAAYVADHLRTWGVKPLGEDGTYFQNIK